MGEGLAYYLDRFPDEPLRLVPKESYVIGRSPDCEVVIAETQASRKHAELVWQKGGFVLRDLESANGTRVNGERIIEARLRPGDNVEIGSRTFSFTVGEEKETREEYSKKSKELASVPTFIGSSPAGAGQGRMAGDLSEFKPPELIQSLARGAKTGRLRVRARAREGWVLFRNGAVFDAGLGSRKAEEAVYAILTLEEGSFEFANAPGEGAPVIRRPMRGLLMEGLRRLDEARRGS